MSIRKELRQKAGLSMTAAAAFCGVAPPTYRTWELDPNAVSEASRAKCDEGFERMQEKARARVAA